MNANQSVEASFRSVENAILQLFKRKRLTADQVSSLRHLISTQGLDGWRQFWGDSNILISDMISDPDGPPVRPLLNAYLITIGKSYLSPYLARYDYSDCKVSDTLAEEALIGAQQIVFEIDRI